MFVWILTSPWNQSFVSTSICADNRSMAKDGNLEGIVDYEKIPLLSVRHSIIESGPSLDSSQSTFSIRLRSILGTRWSFHVSRYFSSCFAQAMDLLGFQWFCNTLRDGFGCWNVHYTMFENRCFVGRLSTFNRKCTGNNTTSLAFLSFLSSTRPSLPLS